MRHAQTTQLPKSVRLGSQSECWRARTGSRPGNDDSAPAASATRVDAPAATLITYAHAGAGEPGSPAAPRPGCPDYIEPVAALLAGRRVLRVTSAASPLDRD